ncbi:TPA: signal recognition particle protein Srp19 [Candidatus Bathyarchaeota archaeon]|nr:signal recognition particle protein Srp19 [Candidatus Bathyarchaeota archaeon]HIJ08736.1 signal recognition particle protein Srp19 [Candidatus Bathyarchaeota archaeon]
MRKQDKAIIWPIYFDQTKTRKKGRRVPRNLSIPYPKIEEVEAATQKLGIKTEISIDASFPKNPWQKTGMIKVEKKMAKEQIISNIARQLLKARSTAAPTPTKKK